MIDSSNVPVKLPVTGKGVEEGDAGRGVNADVGVAVGRIVGVAVGAKVGTGVGVGVLPDWDAVNAGTSPA